MVAQIDTEYIQTRPTKLFSRLISYGLFEGRPLTTSGQWINPLVFSLFALEKRLPRFKQVKKPVFILGSGRSGTTVLGIMLSMHKDVGFLNEPKALWHSIYEDEDLIGSYSSGAAYYRLDESRVTEDIRQNAHRLFGAYLTAVFSTRVVDKYPELVFRVPFVKTIFPDAKFLFLVRNGWDTCASIVQWSKRFGNTDGRESHDWWGRDNRKWHLLLEQVVGPDPFYKDALQTINGLDDHLNMAMVEWIATMREGLRVMQEYPDDVLMVRYERMTDDPVGCFQEISKFCELRQDRTMLSYAGRTLVPVQSHGTGDIHRDLRPLFDTVMTQLAYPYY